MRLGKQKRHRKVVRFYKACFGFREPFKVLCDGTFVHHLLLNKIMPADTALSTTLGASIKIFTTRCVLAELKSLGQSHSESFEAASSLFIARCDHEKRMSADDCILEMIGNDNCEHFFIATQDYKLRKKFHEVPGVPLIYGLRNALYLENPSEFQRQFAKSTEEQHSHVSQPEYIMLKANQKSVSVSEEPRDLSDVGVSEGDQIFGMQNMAKASSGRKRVIGGVQFKRKKAKGPNPLSCKKKKDHVHGNVGSRKERSNESETPERPPRTRKRKRAQTSQAQLEGMGSG